MSLPKISDQKSHDYNLYDTDDENKSFRAKITENINLARLAKEVELRQHQIVNQNRHSNKKIINLNYDLNHDSSDECNEPTKKIIFHNKTKLLSKELFKIKDKKGKTSSDAVDFVKLPKFKQSSTLDFDDEEEDDDDDGNDVIFSILKTNEIKGTSKSASSSYSGSKSLNIDHINKLKQKNQPNN
jgi:hypothetical protein